MPNKLLRSTLIQNVFSLYAGQAAVWIVPFVTVPYLARVLGVSEWGRYSFALSLSTQFALIVEYGFGITANRATARQRAEPAGIGATLGAVILAKLALIGIAVSIAAVEYARIPSLREAPALFWFSVTAGIAQGASFSWCLYGLERISTAVALDLGSRLLGAASLIVVRGPEDAWIFFAAQTAANLLALMWGCALIVRSNAIRWPERGAVSASLRQGLSAMLSRPAFGLFSGLNTFLLGLYAARDVVGQYAGAERICRGIIAFTGPVSMALYPRVSHLLAVDPGKLRRLRSVGSAATAGIGAISSIAAYVFAPAVVRVVLGAGYAESVSVLRILSLLPLMSGINQVLLYQYLFPEGTLDYIAMSLAGVTVAALFTAAALGVAGDAKMIAITAVVAEAAAMSLLAHRVMRSPEEPSMAVGTA